MRYPPTKPVIVERIKMPRKVTAFACEYFCGQRVNTKKASIEAHEKTCFSNPDRRACRTCGYNYRVTHPIPGKQRYVESFSECEKPGFTPPPNADKHGLAWDCPGWIDQITWMEKVEKREVKDDELDLNDSLSDNPF